MAMIHTCLGSLPAADLPSTSRSHLSESGLHSVHANKGITVQNMGRDYKQQGEKTAEILLQVNRVRFKKYMWFVSQRIQTWAAGCPVMPG